jgi:hypothetical protein
VIERVGDLGKQATDVLLRERFRERTPPAQEMARFDRIDPQRLALRREVLKEMLQGMEPAIDRRRRPLDLTLALDKLRHLTPGDGIGLLVHEREKQAKISAIISTV